MSVLLDKAHLYWYKVIDWEHYKKVFKKEDFLQCLSDGVGYDIRKEVKEAFEKDDIQSLAHLIEK